MINQPQNPADKWADGILITLRATKELLALGIPMKPAKMSLSHCIYHYHTHRVGRHFDYISAEAKACCEVKCTNEHAIPVTIFMEQLLSSATTQEDVHRILEPMVVVKVTKEENRRLNAAGLRSRMPDGWDGDPSARHKAVGIQWLTREQVILRKTRRPNHVHV